MSVSAIRRLRSFSRRSTVLSRRTDRRSSGRLDATPIAFSRDKLVGCARVPQLRVQANGLPIDGLRRLTHWSMSPCFTPGTAERDSRVVTAGGRVLRSRRSRRHLRCSDRSARAKVLRIGSKACNTRRDIGAKARGPQGPGRIVKPGAARRHNCAMTQTTVLILMGSDSDAPVMRGAVDTLTTLGITSEMTVASAHRSPDRVMRLVREAPGRGVKVFIVGAGAAAHLAGVVAAHTILPVIRVPIDSSALKGLDALLSTVQMPPGVPVATVSIGAPGATNAAVLAAQILGVGDAAVATRLEAYKKSLADKVEAAAERLRAGN